MNKQLAIESYNLYEELLDQKERNPHIANRIEEITKPVSAIVAEYIFFDTDEDTDTRAENIIEITRQKLTQLLNEKSN